MSKTIQLNGLELAYETFGIASHPTIILIMGLGGQMLLWETAFCLQLAQQGFQVIRFDNRDIGLSSRITTPKAKSLILFALGKFLFNRTPKPPYRLKEMADDVVGLLNHLGIEKAHLVGMSMGGMIAQILAIHYPQRTLSLTTIMSSTLDPSLPKPSKSLIRLLFTKVPDLSNRELTIRQYATLFATIAGSKYPSVADKERLYRELFERNHDISGMPRQMMAMLSEPSMRPGLQKLSIPTLVIHGSHDPVLELACGRDIATHVPNSTFIIIEGMGHTLPTQLQDYFVELISTHSKNASQPVLGVKEMVY